MTLGLSSALNLAPIYIGEEMLHLQSQSEIVILQMKDIGSLERAKKRFVLTSIQ